MQVVRPGIVDSKGARRGAQSRRRLGPGAAQVQGRRRVLAVCGKGEFLRRCPLCAGVSSAVGESLELSLKSEDKWIFFFVFFFKSK